MKNWLLTSALSAALGSALGCQTPSPSVTDQPQALVEDCGGGANFCTAPKVAVTPWSPGDPFPQSAPTTVVVTMRVSPSLWTVFGADPAFGKVLWGRSMKPASLGTFLTTADSMALKYGGVRPPVNNTCPPECGEPLIGYLLER